MTSEGDARENESGRSSSEFGPPLEEFGPPVSEFGPPMGGDTGQNWQVPQQPTGSPELIWRPAGEPETPAASSPQHRVPDAAGEVERPAPPSTPGQSEQAAAPAVPSQLTGREQDSWWNQPTAQGDVPKPPIPAEPGLSWAEDPIAMRLAVRTPAEPEPVRRSRLPVRPVVLGTVVAIVLLIALTGFLIAFSGDSGDTGAAEANSTTAALSCPAKKSGAVTIGNGQGGTDTGPEAILGLQYAFYVERSGAKVRRFVADDANVPTAEDIQKGIDEQVPVGTTHCLRITELASDTFEVDLTEHRPDGVTTVYQQKVTTVSRDGEILVHMMDKKRP
ncbi:hypothetical protein ACL02S_13940 [Nocardia sp. 004]|uniref:hypothetical protein n=1 Tax=Nocardia sp. 004 TaxID=3385978 RepID=UPI00399FF3D0